MSTKFSEYRFVRNFRLRLPLRLRLHLRTLVNTGTGEQYQYCVFHQIESPKKDVTINTDFRKESNENKIDLGSR